MCKPEIAALPLLLVSMSQRPTWASRPAPPDLLWHLHPPASWVEHLARGLVWASLLKRGISPEALEPSNIWRRACMAGGGCFRKRRAGKTRAAPGQETFRGISSPGRGKASCMSGESGGEYRLGTKGSRGSKKEKGPKPKGIKTRIWTRAYMQPAPQRRLCPLLHSHLRSSRAELTQIMTHLGFWGATM